MVQVCYAVTALESCGTQLLHLASEMGDGLCGCKMMRICTTAVTVRFSFVVSDWVRTRYRTCKTDWDIWKTAGTILRHITDTE
jgi:hypothetical protein